MMCRKKFFALLFWSLALSTSCRGEGVIGQTTDTVITNNRDENLLASSETTFSRYLQLQVNETASNSSGSNEVGDDVDEEEHISYTLQGGNESIVIEDHENVGVLYSNGTDSGLFYMITTYENSSETTAYIVYTDESGEEKIENWTFVVKASGECLADALYCIPMAKFRDLLPEYSFDPEAADQETVQAIKDAYYNRMDAMEMHIPSLRATLVGVLISRHDEFRDANYMVVSLKSSLVRAEMLAVGVVVADIESIDYISGKFRVDLKVYVNKITHGAPHDSLSSAMNASWTPLKRTNVMKNSDEEDGRNYYRLLPDEYLQIEDPARPGETLTNDGRCNDVATSTMKPLTKDEYDALSGGLKLQFSRSSLSPVVDSNGFVMYLEAFSAEIKFQPVNAEFYPFQVNILDINLLTPRADAYVGHPLNLYSFCIMEQFTGIRNPIPSLPNDGSLTLVPRVSLTLDAPWWNTGNQQMHVDGTGTLHDDEHMASEKVRQTAAFRIIYVETVYVRGWMVLLPFLFTAFTTQLQWFVLKPTDCDARSMITAVLLIQSLVNSQKPFTGYKNVATHVVYLTYGITGIFVSAVTLMTFINITKATGNIDFLAARQAYIFDLLRLVGLLMTPLYIPVLVFNSDYDTGKQKQFNWLWPLIGSLCLAIFLFRMIWELRKWRKEQKTKNLDKGEDIENLDLSVRAVTSLTVEEVKQWIIHSDELQTASNLTKDDLRAVAQKFEDAKIAGNAFLRTASDPKILIQFVGLTVGEAISISDAVVSLQRKNMFQTPMEEAQPCTNSSTGKDEETMFQT